LLRRVHPTACDAWRGPLEHLVDGASRPVAGAELQCPICLADFAGQSVVRAPCGHDFHLECLEEWVTRTRSQTAGCPLCRESLQIPNTVSC
jgi:hypothetical protein